MARRPPPSETKPPASSHLPSGVPELRCTATTMRDWKLVPARIISRPAGTNRSMQRRPHRRDCQHVDTDRTQYLLRDAPQQRPAKSRATMGAHHQELRRHGGDQAVDRFKGRALLHAWRPAMLVQPGRRQKRHEIVYYPGTYAVDVIVDCVPADADRRHLALREGHEGVDDRDTGAFQELQIVCGRQRLCRHVRQIDRCQCFRVRPFRLLIDDQDRIRTGAQDAFDRSPQSVEAPPARRPGHDQIGSLRRRCAQNRFAGVASRDDMPARNAGQLRHSRRLFREHATRFADFRLDSAIARLDDMQQDEFSRCLARLDFQRVAPPAATVSKNRSRQGYAYRVLSCRFRGTARCSRDDQARHRIAPGERVLQCLIQSFVQPAWRVRRHDPLSVAPMTGFGPVIPSGCSQRRRMYHRFSFGHGFSFGHARLPLLLGAGVRSR